MIYMFCFTLNWIFQYKNYSGDDPMYTVLNLGKSMNKTDSIKLKKYMLYIFYNMYIFYTHKLMSKRLYQH